MAADLVRRRVDLVAGKNALLRQQLIVAERKARRSCSVDSLAALS